MERCKQMSVRFGCGRPQVQILSSRYKESNQQEGSKRTRTEVGYGWKKMKNDIGIPNKLINEKSPYLLQHAYNPVDWHSWGEEAFKKAKNENKPIFLSIGYSTCHWCHVMEHESFEDPEVAKLMNETFVSIKVDREERPDIDSIYMTVCQLMTGAGGWPLSIIMTPDKKPFMAGTYFPKENRFGRIGMKELSLLIKELWKTKIDTVMNSADEATELLKRIEMHSPGEVIDEPILQTTFVQFAHRFDKEHGGFGSSPKFPTPHNLLFLLRYYKRTKNEKALEMVEKTLTSMRNGGMFDHVGYGFHRYSTDSKWLLPHFEKMLYDQALLLMSYVDAYLVTNKNYYKEIANEIVTYILRDMMSPEGGFYSAEDADSEGQEGKYYVWSEDEIKELLNKEEADFVTSTFNISKSGNYVEEATRENVGNNILWLQKPLENPDALSLWERARVKLFNARKKRIPPYKDDKILTDWNGLMIAALSKASQAFNEPKYVNVAKDAADFILQTLKTEEGKLLHRYRDGEAGIHGYLDDYAFLIWGLIELYEASFDVKYLEVALKLNSYLLKHFWDENNGAFYFTSDESETLIIRKKEIYDGAIPSGNSVAMLNLLRLSRITGDVDLENKASKIASLFSHQIKELPIGHTMLLIAADYLLGPSYEMVLVGNIKDKETQLILSSLRSKFLPNKVILFRPVNSDTSSISKIATYTQNFQTIDNKTTIYVCQNNTCNQPTNDLKKVLELLGEG